MLMITLFLIMTQISSYSQCNCVPKDLRIENLKKEEQKALENAGHSRAGYSEEREEKYKERYLNLTQNDVSELFKKDVPLDKPNMTVPYVLMWSALTISETMSFGFNDYKAHFGMISDYFTDQGWQGFANALERSRIIEMLEKHQQLITAVPKGAPVLQSRGAVNGAYQWVVEIPMILTYRSGVKTSNAGLLVTVIVRRSDDKKHPYGIAIDRWIAMSR